MGEPQDFRTDEEIKRDKAKAKYETAKFDAMAKNVEVENENHRLKLERDNRVLEGSAILMGVEKENLLKKIKYISDKIKENTLPEPPVGQGRGKVTKVTNVHKNLVLRMAAAKENHNDICRAIGIKKNKLYELYKHELDLGKSLRAYVIVSAFDLTALKGMSDAKFLRLFQMYVTNNTDIEEKKTVDITSGGEAMQNIVFIPDSPKQGHVDRAAMLAKLKAIPEDGEIVEGEIVTDESVRQETIKNRNSDDE